MHGCIKTIQTRENIRYIVAEKPHDLMEVIKPIVDQVRAKGQEADRCIIFCRTYNDSSEIFELLTLEFATSGVLMSTESGQKVRVCESLRLAPLQAKS